MLKFELKIEEANLILAALAKAPYDQVVGLIQNLQQQAQPQLAALNASADKVEVAAAPESVQ